MGATSWLIISIFPLLPGLNLFRSVHSMITESTAIAVTGLRNCFISAFAIALAISSVHQIPNSFSSRFKKRNSFRRLIRRKALFGQAVFQPARVFHTERSLRHDRRSECFHPAEL